MKGNDQLIAALNDLLAEELTAINQYVVQAEMCENWGYGKLHAALEHQSREEMRHAEWLIQRILFLEGSPTVSKLNPMNIGKSVLDMVMNTVTAEVDAIRAYNDSITLARKVADQSTADLLTKILLMEESHLDWAEVQRDQIEQMGLANYLANQSDGAK